MVEHFEANYLSGKLREHGGNVSRTAESMGMSRQFVHRLIERLGLRRQQVFAAQADVVERLLDAGARDRVLELAHPLAE